MDENYLILMCLGTVSFYVCSYKYVSTFKARLLTNLISISLMNYWDTLMLGIPSCYIIWRQLRRHPAH